MKLCRNPSCERRGIALPDSDFGRNALNDHQGLRDGLNVYCKECTREKSQEYRRRVRIAMRRGAKIRIPRSIAEGRWAR